MQKKLLSLGLIILLVGMVFLAFSSLRDKNLESIEETSNSWQISANLTKGNTYVLDIFSSSQWRDDWTLGGYEEPQPVDVVVESPDGNVTWIKAMFYARLPTSEWIKGTFPSLVYVEYGIVDSDSLEVDPSYPQIRFTVKNGGNYMAYVAESTLDWAIGPPRNMIFYKEIPGDQPSHTVILQGSSIACLFTGSVISVWGAKATESKTRRRKKIKR